MTTINIFACLGMAPICSARAGGARDGWHFSKHFSAATPLVCGDEPGDACGPVLEGARALVAEACERLREVHRRKVATLDALSVPPLIVYAPTVNFAWNSRAPQTLDAYVAKFRRDAWLAPVVRVYETFFAQRPPTAPQGFVLEAGGLDGSFTGSNSYLFERYLGWRGLMVEANQLNFANLLTRRPGMFRAESALCPRAGNLSFMGGGCCSSVAGKVAAHTGAGLRDGKWGDSHTEPRSSSEYKVRCTAIGPLLRAMQVPRVDFFSLDVRGRAIRAPRHKSPLPPPPSPLPPSLPLPHPPASQVESAEYAVLSGMDWSIPFSVLMIERCKASSPELLRSKGFVRAHQAEYTELCRRGSKDCPRDQVWYHPERIQPSYRVTRVCGRKVHTPRCWRQ